MRISDWSSDVCSSDLEALHHPVFKAVKADDGKPPARLQHPLGRAQPFVQLLKLAVHMHADRLKGSGRRVLRLAGAVPRRLADDIGELAGALDRAGVDARPCDAPRLGLLAQREVDVGASRFVGGAEEIGSEWPHAR